MSHGCFECCMLRGWGDKARSIPPPTAGTNPWPGRLERRESHTPSPRDRQQLPGPPARTWRQRQRQSPRPRPWGSGFGGVAGLDPPVRSEPQGGAKRWLKLSDCFYFHINKTEPKAALI